MEKCIYDHYDETLLKEWDFEKNIDTDVFEEKTDSTKKVSWICSICGAKYKGEIKGHSPLKCPECKGSKLIEDMLNFDKKMTAKRIWNFISTFFVCLSLTVLSSCIELKWEKFSPDLLYGFLFTFCVLFEVIILLQYVDRYRYNNDRFLINQNVVLYNLIDKVDDRARLKQEFLNTVENRLVFLTGERIKGFEKTEVLYMFKTAKPKTFIRYWVDKNKAIEFRRLLSLLKDESYFDKLYSSYLTRKLIDFSNDFNIKVLLIGVVITLITLFASLYPNIKDLWFFARKTIISVVLIGVEIVLHCLTYKYRRNAQYQKNFIKLCYISSSVAKALQ